MKPPVWAASVRKLEDAGVALRQQAVLCRSNNRLNDLATALEERGIPVLHLGSLFEREEVRDLLALLSLAVDRFGDALVRIALDARLRCEPAGCPRRHPPSTV